MKARNYREIKGQPYVRKEFIKGHPPPKITKFTMGDPTKDFSYRVSLIAERAAQVRHVALEAGRIAANRLLTRKLGKDFFLRVLPYPHVVLRENKMIFGAHADRLQDGMRAAFGKPIGTAARVKVNQPVMIVEVDEKGIDVAKEALRRSRAKMPMPCRIVIEKISEKLGG
ncbi:MAG TPA: 50S ribosomal protein L16 [Candidatus Bathyarchaeota archaeon]|nr:50S ribosomal protein L16 [Candidatus Bathyarchaeota archaeon]